MIPPQLQKKEYKFIKIGKQNKIPIEKDWETTNNYNYDDPKILKHIEEGNNYGIATGFGNLLVLDFDEQNTQDEKLALLPQTFSVKSGRGLLHLYYEVDDCKSWKIMNENKQTLIDFQGIGKQVIGPGSTHINGNKYQIINDIPITKISAQQIKEKFNDLIIKYELPKIKPTHNYGEDKIRDEIKQKIKVPEILSNLGIDTNQNPTCCPFHESKAGHCLGFNDDVWHCFHCDDKGDIFTLIMKKNNLSFTQAKKLLSNKLGIKTENYNFKEATQLINEKTEFNWLNVANDFIKTQPLFYDRNKIWWCWDFKLNKWIIVDETDILNNIDEFGNLNTIKGHVKQQALEGLRRIARKNEPIPLKETWVQFKNKIIDIENGEQFEVSPKYFATNPLPRDISQTENTPVMDKIFEEWVGKQYMQTLYEIIAFCMIPSYFIHRIFVLVGSGRNGKSKYLNLINNFIGDYNVSTTELDLIIDSRFEMIKFYKKLVCEMGETNFNTMNKTSRIKRLSGQDKVGYEIKGKDPFDDVNYAKLLISTNSLPATEDTTEGFYRRWVVIDFNNKFSEKKDVLKQIPEQEYINLGLKSVNILKKLWVDREFSNEGSIEERTQRYEGHSNPLKKFIDEKAVISPDGIIFKFEFKKEFEQYCKSKGLRCWNDRELSTSMKDVFGFDSVKREAEWFEKEGERKMWWAWQGLVWRIVPSVPIVPLVSTQFSNIGKGNVNSGTNGTSGTENILSTIPHKLKEILALCPKDNIDLLITVFGQKQIDLWIQNATIMQNPPGTYRLL